MAIVRWVVCICGLAVLTVASGLSQTMPAISPQSPPKVSGRSIVLSPTDRKKVVRQARDSYYSLKNEGVIELRCQVLPDWESMYKQLNADAVGRDQLLPLLKKVRFELTVGPDGASTVSHKSDVAPPNEQIAERLRRSISGMEQILTGFLQTWSSFAFGPPLPAIDNDYQLEDVGEKYHLTYKEGSAEVRTSMTHGLAIDEMSVTTPQFSGSVHPSLDPSKRGLVLVGYNATYTAPGSNAQELSVRIDNREVQGFKLPDIVNATVPLPSGKATFGFTFTEYQVKKR